MRAKVFLIISICITLSFPFITEARELSIQQLEERKKADEEMQAKITDVGNYLIVCGLFAQLISF